MFRAAILPIYNDLTKRENLMKSLHGKKQINKKNTNESFNGMIWERIPKFHYLGLQKLKIGIYVIAVFNYDRKASLGILTKLNVESRVYMTKLCHELNCRRKSLAIYKSTEEIKKSRKFIVPGKYEKIKIVKHFFYSNRLIILVDRSNYLKNLYDFVYYILFSLCIP